MDKSAARDKRRKDKHHKKPPPAKPASGGASTKPPKETPPIPSSAPLIVCDVDNFSRRPIESNWNSGKDLPSSGGSDSEDEQLRAADFEKLLQMPPSVSGHLFLSTEKHWLSESEEGIKTGQHFQIDTKQLTASLASIPFYERNDYPSELFSKQEIDSMKLKAQYEAKKYDELCQRSKTTSGKMADKPKPPVKCLIGAGSLPPQPERVQKARPEVEHPPPPPPPRPVPCLIGPMALPPELRNEPNVTGGTARLSERLGEVSLADGCEPVPIGNVNEQQAGRSSSSGDGKRVNDQSNLGGKSKDEVQKETKEDIQQWLDDILDM